MPLINTDGVLWYNVGIFGQLGYGCPNFSNDAGSLNPSILDYVELVGQNLFLVLHHEDADLRTPPSINTLQRVHRLYVRASQILGGRAVPPGKPNMETKHVQPGGEFFRVYPVPYFKLRNTYLRRWAGLVMMSLAEAMQHTENRKTIEISTDFAGLVGQYLTRIYRNMAIELFGKSVEQVEVPAFLLTDADFAGYNPSQFFTSTELVDTVAPLGNVFTEDNLEQLRGGLLTCDLPPLTPYPTNLTNYYQGIRPPGSTLGPDQGSGGGQGAVAGFTPIPAAPAP